MSHGVLGTFTLATEIDRFPPAQAPSGKHMELLVKAESLRVLLATMQAGADLREHLAPGPITIHVLRGRFTVSVGGREIELSPGGLIAIEAKARHAVIAHEDGAFLLTISASASASSLPG